MRLVFKGSKELPRDSQGRLTRAVYGHSAWHRLRAGHLKREPFCRYCYERGDSVKAVFVDHIQPHNGMDSVFFDTNNLQSLCAICHNSAKHREELRRDDIGCDVDGWPRGRDHFWNGGSAFARPPLRDEIHRKRR